MLNPSFAQVGWCPDPSASFQCSTITKATGFTYLMALVMSGRDASLPGELKRKAELDSFLSTPEAAAACLQTNSRGFTALMLAARNSNTDSTEATVAQLLAHESSGQASRIQDNRSDKWTALMLAVRYSGTDSTDATVMQLLSHESSGQVARMQNTAAFTALMMAVRNSNTDSTKATVAQLLAHESSRQVALIQNKHGTTALMLSALYSRTDSTEETVAQLLAHESGKHVVRMRNNQGDTALMLAAKFLNTSTEDTVAMLCPHSDPANLQQVFLAHPLAFRSYLCGLHQSTQERAILSSALRHGLSLVEATTLLYI
jgi:ankyrin repeat protein